ncbi:MAG: thiamine diphosphokinase [Aestuariivita sp.]|nr:thiamine diphosphokinase [Aestuariivita sp.]MCY4345284.1 thiamine diphosphokinase [Aestuariivita sp.]
MESNSDLSKKAVISKTPVTLIGAGRSSRSDLEKALEFAPTLVAADGGARYAIKANKELKAVIGDFDSLSRKLQQSLSPEQIFRVDEQDTTDFEKALSLISAPLVVALGFMWPRIDHQLASFHSLITQCQQPCILVGSKQVAFLCPPIVELTGPAGRLISLFPIMPTIIKSKGLHWELNGVRLSAGGMVGTSNYAVTETVRIETDTPGLLVILNRADADMARDALLKLKQCWSGFVVNDSTHLLVNRKGSSTV